MRGPPSKAPTCTNLRLSPNKPHLSLGVAPSNRAPMKNAITTEHARDGSSLLRRALAMFAPPPMTSRPAIMTGRSCRVHVLMRCRGILQRLACFPSPRSRSLYPVPTTARIYAIASNGAMLSDLDGAGLRSDRQKSWRPAFLRSETHTPRSSLWFMGNSAPTDNPLGALPGET